MSGVFALLAVGAAGTGFVHVHDFEPDLAIAALVFAVVGAVVTVARTVWLAGWVSPYRGLYGEDGAGGARPAA